MIISQKPAALSFLGSLPDMIIDNVEKEVTVLVHAGGSVGVLLARESYLPSPAKQVNIALKEIARHAFDFRLENIPYDITRSNNLQNFAISISEDENLSAEVTFSVIGGAIEGVKDMNFVYDGFLNTCSQIKYSNIDSVEVLNLYAKAPGVALMCDCHVQYAEAVNTLQLATLTAGLLLIPINFRAILNMLPEGTRLLAVDVYTDQVGFAAQRFIFEDHGQNDDGFYFENSLGGVDLIRFTGEKTDKRSYTSITMQQGDGMVDYDNQVEMSFKKNTGYLGTATAKEFARDFLRSDHRYHITGKHIRRIIITKSEAEAQALTLSAFEFEFRYPREDVFAQLRTTASLPAELETLGVASQDNNIYRMQMLIDHLRQDVDELADTVDSNYQILRERLDNILNSGTIINDVIASDVTAYSSTKVEAIKQQLANLFPFFCFPGDNVETNALFNFTRTRWSPNFRQILPMLACAGRLKGLCFGGGAAIAYGPIVWSSVKNDRRWRLTHNLGHTNYIFTGSTSAEGGVKICEKSENYIEISVEQDLVMTIAVDFSIFTFTDPRPKYFDEFS